MRCVPLLAAGLLSAATLTAQQSVLQSSSGRWHSSLVRDGASWAVSGPGDVLLPLEVPASVEFTSFAELESGWLAAGTQKSAIGSGLYLILNETGSERVLSGPPINTHLAINPVSLVADGRLVGLAWLEGDRHEIYEVRASAWLGDRWNRPETVSPAEWQSQLALSGVVLKDGSWLLTWAAGDGQDDEVLWSHRVAEDWTPPRRVHEDNSVPDVLPALVGVGDGALVVWNAFVVDEYRLRTARFVDGAWGGDEFLGAPGSLYPSWIVEDNRAQLLFHTARQPGWTLVELDEYGRQLRIAHVDTEIVDRPQIHAAPAAPVNFRWPAVDPASEDHLLRGAWQSSR